MSCAKTTPFTTIGVAVATPDSRGAIANGKRQATWRRPTDFASIDEERAAREEPASPFGSGQSCLCVPQPVSKQAANRARLR
jgi:hypothetical protein